MIWKDFSLPLPRELGAAGLVWTLKKERSTALDGQLLSPGLSSTLARGKDDDPAFPMALGGPGSREKILVHSQQGLGLMGQYGAGREL